MICIADESALAQAAEIIAGGGVIAFPTDTVYGLGCDLFNVQAVQRIYAIKERPGGMPLIALFADAAQWPQVAAALPPGVEALMARWWPGPLTLIVPARADVPAMVLGGGTTIGMRIPDHPIALSLLKACHRPLATTSANISGAPAACMVQEVAGQLEAQVDLILDGGACPGGMASTVLDCTTVPFTIVREGPVTRADLGL